MLFGFDRFPISTQFTLNTIKTRSISIHQKSSGEDVQYTKDFLIFDQISSSQYIINANRTLALMSLWSEKT